MKKLFIVCLLMLPFMIKAQRLTENNRKGDEAMRIKDYRTAMMWFEEDIPECNRYSIEQLTAIWKTDPELRISLQVVMNKCFRCLTDDVVANKEDTLAIKLLIDYHAEGIGTVKNVAAANNYKEQLEQIRNPVTPVFTTPRDPKDRMKFFMGFHTSMVAPVGIQIGGTGKTVGWYVRFRSNLIFQETQYDCKVETINGDKFIKIPELENKEGVKYYRARNTKSTYLLGSAGIIYKITDNINISTGVGYWEHKRSREYIKVNDNGTNAPGTGWARDTERSMSGVTVDLDGTYVLSGKFYGSLGVSMMNFKYVTPNLGVGFYF